LIAAAVELDDRPGPQRDFLQEAHRRRFAFIAKAARMAVEAGHFRADLDTEQFSFDVTAIALGYHHLHRMLRDPKADKHARTAFERILASAKACAFSR
jgi:hypothetical protein